MNYIITEIVDKFTNDKKAAWYTFIWDRMRAIRQNITIQRLTGPTVVEMLEKTARFHILCSYRLCEESPAVFDFKLNEDSLVHCIELLRGMYADCRANPDGRSATNQGEFLCYHILRNLDKESLVDELSSIEPHLLKTDSNLLFAIRTFVAYKTLNYCTFMRLLLDSNLLQACLLNRYLSRVRLSAFSLIKLATSSRSPMERTPIPQDYFMKTLLLKEHELAKFCKLVGCDLVDQKVLFLKNKELNSNVRFKPQRTALIDRKLDKLKFSGIVNGTVQKEASSVNELLSLFKKVDFFNCTD